MKKQTGKRITIIFSRPDWLKLRRLQEKGLIISFQRAAEAGVKLLIEKLEEKKGEEEHENRNQTE
jgi:hypothetical protein